MRCYMAAGLMLATSISAQAHDATHHNQQNGQGFGISYSYSNMNMEGNRDGTDKVSNQEIFMKGFMMAPTEMTHEKHNIRASYSTSRRYGFSVDVPYIVKDMEHVDMMGMKMRSKSKGMGDTRLMGNYAISDSEGADGNNLNLYYGLSIPTGSVKKNDMGQRLEYAMQTGTGTYDPILGLGYNYKAGNWNLSASTGTVLRFGHNSEDYRFGNEYTASLGVANQINEYVAANVRLDGRAWGNVKGSDGKMNTMMSPMAINNMQGGERVDAVIGLTLTQPHGTLAGTSLGAEFGVPVYQSLDGPQMETDYHFMVNLGKTFGVD